MSKALVLKGADFSVNKLDTVIVTDPIPCTGISLSASTASVEAGKTVTLTATVTPNDTTDTVVWASSDETKATVSSGVVTGVGKGTATITATCGNFSVTCTITVIAYYTEPVCGYVLAQNNRLDYRSAYNYKTGGTFNDPFLRKVSNGQTIKVRPTASAFYGLYLYMYVYATGTFTDKCEAVGDNYVLTQAMLDTESSNTYGILLSSTKLSSTDGRVDSWDSTKDYTATQDCYVAFWFNKTDQSDISAILDDIADAISITIE